MIIFQSEVGSNAGYCFTEHKSPFKLKTLIENPDRNHEVWCWQGEHTKQDEILINADYHSGSHPCPLGNCINKKEKRKKGKERNSNSCCNLHVKNKYLSHSLSTLTLLKEQFHHLSLNAMSYTSLPVVKENIIRCQLYMLVQQLIFILPLNFILNFIIYITMERQDCTLLYRKQTQC